MTTPTIELVRPSRGWTAGGTLIEISGTGFRLQARATPGPRTTGRTPAPAPSVQVLFDGRPSPRVWVISGTILRCITPRHPPTRIDENGTTISDGTVDVQVQNLDDDGAVISGELATVAQAYSFVRPELDGTGAWYTAAAMLQEHLRDLVVENVGMNPSVEYDAETGDFTGFVKLASLPGIAITKVAFPTGDDDAQDQSYTQAAGDPSGHLLQRRGALVNDLTASLVVVTNNEREMLNLGEILAHVLKHHPIFSSTLVDLSDPAKGTVDLVLFATGPFALSERLGNNDLITAELPIVVKQVLSDDLPGAPLHVGEGGARKHLRWDAGSVQEWIAAYRAWEVRGKVPRSNPSVASQPAKARGKTQDGPVDWAKVAREVGRG